MLLCGLNSDNVTIAIKQVHHYVVDVSGGVEQHPGVKSFQKTMVFCKKVKRINDSVN